MKSYMRANHKRFVKSQENAASHHWAQDAVYDYDSESDEDAQECHNKGRRTWLQDLDDFFARWNGPWWKEGCVVHYCRGLSCCSSPQDSVQRLTSSAEKVLFRSIVPTICASKWSKLGPVVDWILVGQLAHGMLCSSFLKLGMNTSLDRPNHELDDEVDAKLSEDLNFSVLKGKRYKVSCEFLSDGSRKRTLLHLAIAIEPTRYLSAWWMRRARETDRLPSRVPFLDMLFAPASPLQIALQYIATLLHSKGRQDRLALLWRYDDCDSYSQWCRAFPQNVRALRLLLFVVYAGMYRRHALTFKSLTWRLLQLSDPRLSDAEKEVIVGQFNGASPCCLAPGFPRQIKTQGISGNELLSSPLWQSFLLQFSRIISQQVCDLEWRHGRNRGRSNCHGKSRFHHFCASATLAEGKLLHTARDAFRKAMHKHQLQQLNDRPSGPAAITDAQKELLRAQTPAEIHKKEWLAAQRGLGRNLHVADAATWNEWRAVFDSLPPEQHALLVQRAKQSKVIALDNRRKKKEAQRAEEIAGSGFGCCMLEASARPHCLLDIPADSEATLAIASLGWPSSTMSMSSMVDFSGENSLANLIKDTGLLNDSAFPLSESVIEQHASFRKAEQRFKAECGARPTGQDRFPEEVTYSHPCGGLCANSTDEVTLLLFNRLRRAFCLIAERFGIGRRVACADVILALELQGDAEGPVIAVAFVDLRLANGSNGFVPAGQTFFVLACDTEDIETQLQYRGVRLRYPSLPRVPPRKRPRPPLDRAAVGCLQAMSEDELSQHVLLVKVAPDRRGHTRVRKITIRQVEYRDINLSEVVVEGVVAAFEAVEVNDTQIGRKRQRTKKTQRDFTSLLVAPRAPAVAAIASGSRAAGAVRSAGHADDGVPSVGMLELGVDHNGLDCVNLAAN